MKCSRCGYEIESLGKDWWSQEISNSYKKGKVHSNGFFCFGLHNTLGGFFHTPAFFRAYLTYLEKPSGSSCHKQ